MTTTTRLPWHISRLIDIAFNKSATDLLIAANRLPCMRVAGILVPIEESPIPSRDTMYELARALTGEAGIRQLEESRDRDFSFEVEGFARFPAEALIQQCSARRATPALEHSSLSQDV